MFYWKYPVWSHNQCFLTFFSTPITMKSNPSCRAQNSLSNDVLLRKFYVQVTAYQISKTSGWIILTQWKKTSDNCGVNKN